jgi:hypothetical protein
VAEIFDFSITDASNTARWPEGMLGSAVNNAGRADEGILARWYFDSDTSITSGGSSNAYTISSNRSIPALVNDRVVAWTANHTNTGAATLALNGLTAKAIRRPNGDALEAGDIVSGQAVIVVYKSSPDYWQMLSPGKFSASDTVAGALEIAVQSEMEAAASAVLAVTPGRQHFHPGHPKAGGNLNGSGTPAFAAGDYGMGVVTDHGTGNYTLALDTAFADTSYWMAGFARSTVSAEWASISAGAGDDKTESTLEVRTGRHGTSGTVAADVTEAGIMFWGDYA